MSLLRASSQASDIDVDIETAVDPTSTGDAGIKHGDLLLRFATAAQLGQDDLDTARADLLAALGHEALTEAAATVAVFNGLVRVADGTGIQLDDGALADSADYRDRLGVNAYGGATNSTAVVEARRAGAVEELFG